MDGAKCFQPHPRSLDRADGKTRCVRQEEGEKQSEKRTPGVLCRLGARSSPSAMPAREELALRLLSIAHQRLFDPGALRGRIGTTRCQEPVLGRFEAEM